MCCWLPPLFHGGWDRRSTVFFAVLLINALIGTIQEYSAEQAAALRKMVPYHATVIRDSKSAMIITADIVPGDYVLLVSGNRVPPDIRLSIVQGLHVDESMLTGESVATVKDDSVS